jgi:hypothetical protein
MAHRRDEPIVTIATFDTEFEASLARGTLVELRRMQNRIASPRDDEP